MPTHFPKAVVVVWWEINIIHTLLSKSPLISLRFESKYPKVFPKVNSPASFATTRVLDTFTSQCDRGFDGNRIISCSVTTLLKLNVKLTTEEIKV